MDTSDRIDFGGQPWKAIPRETLRDQRLSPKAKGGLVTLLSHDEGWVRSCIQMLQVENNCGREQSQAIMKELCLFGYAKLETVSNGGKVRKFYTVFAVPDVGIPMDGKPARQETRLTGIPSVVVEPHDEEPHEVEPEEESHTQLSDQFASMIEQNTGRRPKTDRSWSDTFRKLEAIDGYDIDTIREVITWGCGDPFWSQVLLSAPRLRAKKNGVMKFEQVRVSMVGTVRNQPGLSNAVRAEELRKVGR